MSTRARHEGYEKRDAEARPLFIAGFVLALVLVGSLALSAWLNQRFADEIQATQSTSPLEPLRNAPPGPALQAQPAAELARQRAWEERLLTTTGWIDPLNKVVRIPVSQALELSLREGFPTRSAARPAHSGKEGK